MLKMLNPNHKIHPQLLLL